MNRNRGASVLLPLAAAALVLPLSGCGASAAAGAHGSKPPTAPPGGGNHVLLQIGSAGGFVAPAYAVVNSIPSLTIYTNGRAIIEASPSGDSASLGSAILREGTLSPSALSKLRHSITASGLFTGRPPDFGNPAISDLPSTTILARTSGGRAVKRSVYALGLTGSAAGSLTKLERQNRGQLSALASQARSAVHVTGPYVAQRVEVYAAQTGFATPLQSGVGPWPGPRLTRVLTGKGAGMRCGVVSGGLAQKIQRLEAAHPGMTWKTNHGPTYLMVKPLLPGEKANC